MGKERTEDLTGSCDPKILAAIKTIGQGLMDLADALVAPGAPAKPEPRSGAARSPNKEAPPPAEDTQEDDTADEDTGGDEPEVVTGDNEIKLSELQQMAKDLIKAGGRPKLLKILEVHDLENVSSAPSELWPTLKKDLEEAAE